VLFHSDRRFSSISQGERKREREREKSRDKKEGREKHNQK
jgi:hypothetical protein